MTFAAVNWITNETDLRLASADLVGGYRRRVTGHSQIAGESVREALRLDGGGDFDRLVFRSIRFGICRIGDDKLD